LLGEAAGRVRPPHSLRSRRTGRVAGLYPRGDRLEQRGKALSWRRNSLGHMGAEGPMEFLECRRAVLLRNAFASRSPWNYREFGKLPDHLFPKRTVFHVGRNRFSAVL